MTAERAAILAELRRKLAATTPVVVAPVGLPTGLAALDRAIGGWPSPGLSAVVGAAGSGRLGLLLPAMIALTCAGRTVAVVDAPGWLNPPGLPGLALTHLLLIRAGAGQAAWAAEQLARSGALPLVVLLDPPPLGRSGRRLQHAAEAGRCAVVVLSERADADLPAALRLEMIDARHVRVARGHSSGIIDLGDPAENLDGVG